MTEFFLSVTIALICILMLLELLTSNLSTVAKIVKIIVGGLAALTFLAFVIVALFFPNYTTEATVKSVGGKGVTVVYVDEYGTSAKTATVDVDSVSEYNVGDTVTIEVYNTHVKIAGGATK